MVIDLSNVVELKKEVLKKYGVELHFHDVCGGQYFSLDKSTPELVKNLSDFFTQKGYRVSVSKDGKGFSLSK